MSSSNYCFLTCIQISQEAGQVVWYSHLFKNFPQFIPLLHMPFKMFMPTQFNNIFFTTTNVLTSSTKRNDLKIIYYHQLTDDNFKSKIAG